ncbi:hypothetical protein [Phenylobacterium sp.]|uniref:hypothetical protein n=1 Tax=Phenylobacterium sp. TaxID=1871053 RepID=UPI00289ECBA4|nr:hypothetical protein [Phenylobacterium sp.]
MAFMAKLNEPHITRDMYEQVRAEIGWDQNPPAGCVLHMASFDEAGAHTVDIWDNEEDLKEYLEDRFFPALRKLGVSTVNPTWSEMHVCAAAPEIQRYVLDATPLRSRG